MANFDTIKTAIDANIKTNGTQDITGGKMNSILKQMVDATDEQLTELDKIAYLISSTPEKLSLPNIDTENKILSFGEDPVFKLGNKFKALGTARNVIMERESSSANLVIYNIETDTFYCKRYLYQLSSSEFLVGTFRLNASNQLESWNFPFEYTINNNSIHLDSDFLGKYISADLHRLAVRFPLSTSYIKRIFVKMKEGWNVALNAADEDIAYPDYTQTADTGWKSEICLNISNFTSSKYFNIVFRKSDNNEAEISELLDNIEYLGFESYSNVGFDVRYCLMKTREGIESINDEIAEINRKINVSITITGSETYKQEVNIDTVKKIIDFGTDPVLHIGNRSYALGSSYRNILYYEEGNVTGATKLIFNLTTKKIYAKGFRYILEDNEVLIGGIRSERETHEFLDADFPFDYTVDGRHPWEVRQLNCKTNLTFIAHRGVHINGIPENSLDAYRYAGYCGFEYAETDFCPTADDELVLMHDSSINRTMYDKSYIELTETVYVRDKTLSELRENYVLKASDMRMRRPIPTLEEFFVTCKNSGVFPIPEIKTSGTTEEHVRKAYELGKKILGEGNFGFTSFSAPLLDFVRSLSEKTLLLYINDGILGTTNSVTGQSRESEYTWWYPSYSGYGLTTEVMQQYREAGIKVAVWTVPVSQFDALLKLGVDCLAGDYLSPTISGKMGFVAKSDLNFSDFRTDGVIENRILKLSSGQTITFSAQKMWMGGYYLSIIGKGNFTLSAPNLNVTINNNQIERYIYQGIVNNVISKFSITAVEDTEIEFVEFSAVEL